MTSWKRQKKLYAAVNDPEGTDATLPYQTVHILKELGVTVEIQPAGNDRARGERQDTGRIYQYSGIVFHITSIAYSKVSSSVSGSGTTGSVA